MKFKNSLVITSDMDSDRKFIFILDSKEHKRYYEIIGETRKAIKKNTLKDILNKLDKKIDDVPKDQKSVSKSTTRRSKALEHPDRIFFQHRWKKKNAYHVFGRFYVENSIKMTLKGIEYTFVSPQHGYEACLRKGNKKAIAVIINTEKPGKIAKALKNMQSSNEEFADEVKVTAMALVYKALVSQHETLRTLLRESETKSLHEFCQFGGLWGTNYDIGSNESKGKDQIGQILVEIRSTL